MRIVMTTLVAVLTALALPSAALAGGGNSAIEEYVLDIPSGGGADQGAPSDTGSGAPLSPGTEAALEAEGEDGAAAAKLAKATGPDRNGDGARADEPADAGGGSGIAEVIGDLASGSDAGMGPMLPIVLGLALIGAVGIAIARRAGQDST